MEVSIYTAKTQLSALVDRAQKGEDIIITRHGRPVARLGPIEMRKTPRPLGLLAGKVRVSDDFDDPLPEDLLAAFEGRTA